MLLDYLFFLAKTLTWVLLGLVFFSAIILLIARARGQRQDGGRQLEITAISDELTDLHDLLEKETLSKEERKHRVREKKLEKKIEKKEKKHRQTKEAHEAEDSRLFVLRFEGDMEASAIDTFREAVTAVLLTAQTSDEVLVTIDSPGGQVHRYGFAAAQMERIRARNIILTVSVDTVAASGGYMMASVADRIIAAPFAVVGSIGVIAEIPNFHRVLKKYDVDYEQFTAGEFKSTVSTFAKNTEKGKEKLQEEINASHQLFKNLVKKYRPQIDIESVATGEYWHAVEALPLGLVDALLTSDDYILQAHQADRPVYEVRYVEIQPVLDRILDRIHSVCRPLSHWLAVWSSR